MENNTIIMNNIKTFRDFMIFENSKSFDISSLYDFANKPLLGGYILDVFVNNMGSIGIRIADEPDIKAVPFVGVGTRTGKKTMDFNIIESIIYWLDDDSWDLGKLAHKRKTVEDEKLLEEIATTINKNK